MKYFISKNGKKRGPYEIEEIKEMKLFNTVLVWREGMNEWQPAKDIEELNQITFMPPPSIPGHHFTFEEIVKVIFFHLLFGCGFYYLNQSVKRKSVYPLCAVLALFIFI